MVIGDVVTAHLSGGVGTEKGKSRPAVVVYPSGPTVLVFAVTDARKKRLLPTHVRIAAFASGTQVKPALVTAEHAWFLDSSRIVPRPGARPLDAVTMARVGRAMRIAFGLDPVRSPPREPDHRRGDVLRVDLGEGVGAEASGVVRAVVLSNDLGNYFGQHLLVAPVIAPAVIGVATEVGTVDLGRLRVVDLARVVRGRLAEVIGGDLHAIDTALGALVPPNPPPEPQHPA